MTDPPFETLLADVARERDVALRIVERVLRAPEHRRLRDLHEGVPLAIDAIERGLIGTLLAEPALLPLTGLLQGREFLDRTRGAIFEAVGLHGGSPILTARYLEGTRGTVPKGWLVTLCAFMDEPFCDEETLPLYVKAIREAALERRRKGR